MYGKGLNCERKLLEAMDSESRNDWDDICLVKLYFLSIVIIS